MCVIIVKPKNISFPSDEILEMAWTTNPDGAGVAWIEDGKQYFEKGFMDYDDFRYFLKTAWIDQVQGTVIFHFRIKTHGSVSPELTHPFPISKKRLYGLSGTNKMLLFHNGTLTFKPGKGESDTSYFTKRLALIRRTNEDFIHDKQAQELIKKIAKPSRLAILAHLKLYLFGKWHKYQGLMVSNERLEADCTYANSHSEQDYPMDDPREYGYDCDCCPYSYDCHNCPIHWEQIEEEEQFRQSQEKWNFLR